MLLAIIRLLPLALRITCCVLWIHALVNYDPDVKPCDGDCEKCMFPSAYCEWKEKGSE